MGASGGLSAKQQKALAALLTEPTIGAAAAKVGIGESTLHSWLRDEPFDEAYRLARKQAVGQAVARLQQVSSAAVQVLHDVMLDVNAPSTARIGAARTVIETALKAIDQEDLATRIAALEVALTGN